MKAIVVFLLLQGLGNDEWEMREKCDQLLTTVYRSSIEPWMLNTPLVLDSPERRARLDWKFRSVAVSSARAKFVQHIENGTCPTLEEVRAIQGDYYTCLRNFSEVIYDHHWFLSQCKIHEDLLANFLQQYWKVMQGIKFDRPIVEDCWIYGQHKSWYESKRVQYQAGIRYIPTEMPPMPR